MFCRVGRKKAYFANPTNIIEWESILSNDLAEKLVWFVGLRKHNFWAPDVRGYPPESLCYRRQAPEMRTKYANMRTFHPKIAQKKIKFAQICENKPPSIFFGGMIFN